MSQTRVMEGEDSIVLVVGSVPIARLSRSIPDDDLATVVALAEEAARMRARIDTLLVEHVARPHIACVVHDVNNFLAAILASAQVLAESNAEHAELAAEITAAGRAVAAALRPFCTPPVRHGEQAVDVNAVVSGLGSVLSRLLVNTGDLTLELAPSVPPAAFDESALQRALVNLVINARDAFSVAGRVVISTRVAADGSVVVCVEDNGRGMDEGTLRRATEPFFTTKTHGTGLGLASVAATARAASGTLNIASSPGTGTRASIVLRQAAAGRR
jgi:two-component system, cell cycle sensor histidine kinase and response regulator CckA